MAAQDYDSQLLESVSVRRRRLRDALLFGAQRQRRSVDERIGKIFAGIVIAAVLCAGCVGWSFVSNRIIGKSPYGGSVQPSVTPSPSVSTAVSTAPTSTSTR
ncbi:MULTISPECIES: hypothetical protein [Streptomyces]|uniref:Uncharacterized protein n=1 Tax=Streptomyces europaeiscabiei TaxID=146819 RepID=A0AAJ2URW2_9ACTN|nr:MULTISPECIES: hypothetical protein [Streptomyces]WRZ51295.1 hypothetical protein OG622_32390 [Streptomyces sp. NBC_01314]MDX2526856.1 hypothetical protein [Streptomyces europaeiscabiei]MDX2766306.1 hypothetical protein [Streptomyces europaeiscabiei]MDX2770070.1 hypothetical protein [Streptomyces europaeiscabiei]MDX3137053.1 hypothetical protein [Streptomyces europaeiscabiei]